MTMYVNVKEPSPIFRVVNTIPLMPSGIIEEISTLQREHDLVIFVVAMQTHDQLNQARIYVCHLYKIYGSSSKCKNDVL